MNVTCKTFRKGLILFILSCLILCLNTMVAEEEEKEETPPNPVVARFEGRDIAMNDLIEGARIRGGFRYRGRGADRLRSLNPDQLEEFVKEYLFKEKLAAEAKEKNFDDDTKIQDQLKYNRSQIIANLLYKQEILDKVPEVAEEELKQYYEDNKEEKYKQHFTFKMRHIYISTYKPYTVKEGDTLEKIAGKISGNKKMMEYILTDDEDKELRYVKPEEREEKPFKPVEPGEKLLVPMSEKERKAAEENIRNVHKKLKDGQDFVKLAEEVSQSGPNSGKLIGPIAPDVDSKPMLPEIVEAVKKTPVGEITDVIKTKHGFNIIKVEEKNEAGFIPFEKVERSINARLNGERRMERSKEFLLSIAKNSPGVTFNPEIFTDDKRTSESLVISIGDDVRFTLEDFGKMMEEYPREKPTTNEERALVVIQSRTVLLPLLAAFGEYKKFPEREEFKKEYAHREIMVLADGYLRQLQSEVSTPLKEEIEKYYNENKDRYTDPRQFDISLIGLKIGERGDQIEEEKKKEIVAGLTDKLTELRKTIKTREDFEKKAEEISEDPTGKRKGSVGMVPLNYRKGFNGQLDNIKAGEISEPFEYGNFVYLLRVNKIVPERLRPLDECERAVRRDYGNQKRNMIQEEKMEKYLKKGNYEFLLKEE